MIFPDERKIAFKINKITDRIGLAENLFLSDHKFWEIKKDLVWLLKQTISSIFTKRIIAREHASHFTIARRFWLKWRIRIGKDIDK